MTGIYHSEDENGEMAIVAAVGTHIKDREYRGNLLLIVAFVTSWKWDL